MDSRGFRSALGQFPTGVVVATARTAADQIIGMTMSSFNSMSLDPPLILFSVLRQAHSFSVWQGVDRYAINVLNEERKQVSNRLARSKGDKWEGISPLTGDTGVPMLPNAAVVFECETHARFDGGDHEIFGARVAAMHEHSVNRGRPLVLFEGRYRQLASSANARRPPHEAVLLHGW